MKSKEEYTALLLGCLIGLSLGLFVGLYEYTKLKKQKHNNLFYTEEKKLSKNF